MREREKGLSVPSPLLTTLLKWSILVSVNHIIQKEEEGKNTTIDAIRKLTCKNSTDDIG